MKWLNRLENTIIALGSAIGIANIETIMGIILLSVQVVIILTKCIVKFVNFIKLKKINEAIAELERAQDELNKLIPKEATKEEEENGGEN